AWGLNNLTSSLCVISVGASTVTGNDASRERFEKGMLEGRMKYVPWPDAIRKIPCTSDGI
ncbi:MAG TPA: hypothetical protein VJ692_14100, partial [Nitrospiraceae bacterium]|nr:hypothetical protein [Nitrospiraceae bacterium]